jgi:thioesterase domain-containing protein
VSEPSLLEIERDGPIDPRGAEWPRVIAVNRAGSRPPLVLVRTWWGEAEAHGRLGRALSPEQPLWSIAPPRGQRVEDYPQDAAAWAELALARIRPLPLPEPYLIGGWSFGGVIALECARRLAAEGRRVALVALIDSRVPKRRARERPQRGALRGSLHAIDRFLRLESASARRAFVVARARRRAAELRDRARRLFGRPAPAQAKLPPLTLVTSTGEVMSLLQRTVWVAYLKYKPQRIELPVLQLWTDESREAQNDPSLGFGPNLRGPLWCERIPGGHFSIWTEENLKTLAPILERALRRALEDAGA